MEDTKVTTRDAGFHSTDTMQDIGGALKNLSMGAGGNRDIITKLTEDVEQLTKTMCHS